MCSENRYKIPDDAKVRKVVAGKTEEIPVSSLAKNLAIDVYGKDIGSREIDIAAFTIYAIDNSPQNVTGAFTVAMAERVLEGRDDFFHYHPDGVPDY